MDRKEVFQKFEEQIVNSDTLSINMSGGNTIELISSSLRSLFSLLFAGKKIKFTSLFKKDYVSSVDNLYIDVNGTKLLRKKQYNKQDLLPLIGDSLKGDEVISNLLKLEQDKRLMNLEGKDDIYLSFSNLYYHKRDERIISIAPVIFFKVVIEDNNGEYTLKLDYNAPIFNESLQYILKDQFNIDLSYYYESFDIFTYIDFIKSKIEGTVFALDDALMILKCDVLKENRLAYLVSNKDKLIHSDIYRAIDEGSETVPSFVEYHFSHPHYIRDNLNKLNSHALTKISKDSKLGLSFIKDTIDEYVLASKNVLVLSGDEKKNKSTRKTLINSYFDMYMSYKDPSKPNVAIYTLLESLQRKRNYFLDADVAIKAMEINDELEKKKNFDVLLKSIQIPTNEDNLTIFNNYFKYLDKSDKIYNFDEFTSYTHENYLNDEAFLLTLETNPFFLENPISKHPFDGIDSKINETDYDKLVAFLNQFKYDIDSLIKAIDVARIKDTGWSNYTSLQSLLEHLSIFDLLHKYNGFDIRFFRIYDNDELRANLETLKDCYRKEASMKLTINISTNEKIWSYNFKEILSSLKATNEKETRKKVRSLLKLNTKANYESLIVLIDKYEENKDTIASILPIMPSEIEEFMNDVDGINFVEESLDFIRDLKVQVHSVDLDFHNKFIENLFRDKTFADMFNRELFNTLFDELEIFRHDIKKYKRYFEGNTLSLSSSSFDEIKSEIDRRLNGSKNQFEEYLVFAKQASKASDQLQKALGEEDENNNLLTNFRFNYLLSLYQHLLKRAMIESHGIDLIEDASENTFELYEKLKVSRETLHTKLINEFEPLRKKIILQDSYNMLLKKLKNKYHKDRFFSIKDALNIASSYYYKVYPLETKSINKVDSLGTQKFDLVIMIVDEKTSYLDIMSALRYGNKILFYGDDNELLENVEEIKFSLDKDFDIIDSSYDGLIDRVKDSLSVHSINLIRNKEIDNGIVLPLYFEKGNEKFALRFESKNEHFSDIDNLSLPKDLLLAYNIKVVTLYIIPYIVYEDLTVLALYNDIRERMKVRSHRENPLELLSYDQQRRVKYFQMLEQLDNSFEKFTVETAVPNSLEEAHLRSSSKNERPINTISPFEIADGIMRYLKNFTYLSRDTLIKHLATVVGTDDLDIDYRLLFTKSMNLLISLDKIKVSGSRLYLNREPN